MSIIFLRAAHDKINSAISLRTKIVMLIYYYLS